MKKIINNVFVRKILLICLLLLIGAYTFYAPQQINQPPGVEGDELLYAYYCGIFPALFINHNQKTINMLFEDDFGLRAVPLGLYYMGGLVYYSDNRYLLKEPTKKWIISEDWTISKSRQKTLKNHPLPQVEQLIYFIRKKMKLVLTLAGILWFMLVFRTRNKVAALLMILLLFRNIPFLHIGRSALLESFWFIHYCISLYLLLAYTNRLQKRRLPTSTRIIWVISLGISAGFLAAVKISGFVINLIIPCTLFFVWLKEKINDKPKINSLPILFIDIFIVTTVSLGTFILLHPLLLQEPIVGITKIFTLFIENQKHLISRYSTLHLQNLGDKFVFIYKKIGKFYPLFYKIYIHPLILWMILILGFVKIYKNAYQSFINKQLKLGSAFIICSSFIVILITYLPFLNLAYPRYIFILIPYAYCFMGYGLYFLYSITKKSIIKNRNNNFYLKNS